MQIQTKPIKPGKPLSAIQFEGDQSVHSGIFQVDFPYTHFCVKGVSYRNSKPCTAEDDQIIEQGDWLVEFENFGEMKILGLITKSEFDKRWRVVI